MSDDPIGRLNTALEGRYHIERQLGEGGMATVYLADDLRHERKVALKVLKPELAAVVGAERFLAEIKTTANLQHPHILPLYDSGEAGSFLFYVMPYVQGETLRDRLDRERQLPVEEAVALSSIVTSSPPTSSSRTGSPCSRTSGSPSRSAPRGGRGSRRPV
jgi:serine/threonine-protein kinase